MRVSGALTPEPSAPRATHHRRRLRVHFRSSQHRSPPFYFCLCHVLGVGVLAVSTVSSVPERSVRQNPHRIVSYRQEDALQLKPGIKKP